MKAHGALLTTRGGALRDVGDLDAAEKSAEAAIQAYPEAHHAHSLLGAILYQQGRFAEGDEHFALASSLGGEAKQRDRDIKAALELAGAEIQHRGAQHLLAKDPLSYGWARHYARRF